METAVLISGIVGAMEADFFKNAINTSISTLQTSLRYIKNRSHENELFDRVQKKLHEFDIELQFKLAQKYIEICKDKVIASYLVSSIDTVNNLTEKIRLKISGHRNLWFHRYRFCDVETDLAILESEMKLLEKRIAIISKFSKIG